MIFIRDEKACIRFIRDEQLYRKLVGTRIHTNTRLVLPRKSRLSNKHLLSSQSDDP